MKRSYLMLLIFSLLLFIILAGTKTEAAQNSNFGWIVGNVKNAMNDQPIQNAKVEIHARIIDKLPDGTPSLRSFEETILLKSLETDASGRFFVQVPLNQGLNLFKVVVNAEGFLEVFDGMVNVKANETVELNFELTPDFESAQIPESIIERELHILHEKHERLKQKLYQDNPLFRQELIPEDFSYKPNTDELIENELLFQSTYSVPDQVYVCDLQGYTGYINFDDFISGVVSAEMGDTFPYSALKAQAVAARSYALKKYNATGCANGGQAYTSSIGSKSRNSTLNTTKIVILYSGDVIYAYYSARCNGDYTLNSEDGICKYGCSSGTPSECGASSECNSLWGNVVPYARSKPCSNHSNCSEVTEPYCCCVFTGGRWVHIYGHGVGMCQRGAEEFAKIDCRDWQSILLGYYTSVELGNAWNFTINDRIKATDNVWRRDNPCGTQLDIILAGSYGTIIDGPQLGSCVDDCWTWWKIRWDNGAIGWSVEAYLNKSPDTFNFSLSASPTSGSVTQGGSVSTTVTSTLVSGSTTSVSFSASGLPTGATASFSPTSCSPTCSSTLTISTSPTTPTGSYTITITGTGGGLSRTANYTLTVNPTFNFSLSASPASGSVTQGGSVSTTVTSTLVSGSTTSVSFSASGLPTGATASFSPTSCSPTCSSTLTISTSPTTPTGSYTITITGTGGGLSRTANYTLTVNPPAPPGTLQFSSATYSVNENGGSVTITATRTGGSSGAVGVSYATSNGTATAGSDYTATSGTLSWANGDTSNKTFSVPILDDSTYEVNETVNLTLTGPTGGATLGSPNSATITIQDNDMPVVTVTATDARATERGLTTGTFTVSRTGSTSAPLTVYYTTSGTATPEIDYQALSGSVTIPAVSSTATITVTPIDDTLVERNERVIVTLSSNSAYTVGFPKSAIVRIISDD